MPFLDIPKKNPEEEGMNTLHQTAFGSPTTVPTSFGAPELGVGMPQPLESSPEANMEAPAPVETQEMTQEDYRRDALRNIQNRFRGERYERSETK